MATVSIPLTQGKFALIDAEDAALVSAYQWHAIHIRKHLWYAATTDSRSGKRTYLHQLICPAEPPLVPDHIDGNGLNCRRSNLQPITHAQNIRKAPQHHKNATSPYRGVSYCRKKNSNRPWLTQIRVNNRRLHVGEFLTELDAARAYDRAAREHHKEFAVLNFPDEPNAPPPVLELSCEACGALFVSDDNRLRKGCSDECRARLKREREAAWRQANRERLRDYDRNRPKLRAHQAPLQRELAGMPRREMA